MTSILGFGKMYGIGTTKIQLFSILFPVEGLAGAISETIGAMKGMVLRRGSKPGIQPCVNCGIRRKGTTSQIGVVQTRGFRFCMCTTWELTSWAVHIIIDLACSFYNGSPPSNAPLAFKAQGAPPIEGACHEVPRELKAKNAIQYSLSRGSLKH
ncbi:hypothetical protein BDZ94DRAFT_300486 [Collybia nuda]|uniref:Uncharacterized protein n=1 Tax=Collybia nuda TaxID=64659 RepID=A0A9P6CH24_9AGAR|nr:hypothetical protein BDZ94DRAFT_300486 [Collybia nuda]